MKLRPAAIVALAALHAGGCGGDEPPPERVEGEHVVVRAAVRSLAHELAREADRLFSCLQSTAGAQLGTRPEIWVAFDAGLAEQAPWHEPEAYAERAEGRIVLLSDPRSTSREVILAHELAHVIYGARLASLPHMIREGVCDALAMQCSSDASPLVAARVLGASRAWSSMRFVLTFARPDDGALESITLSGDDPPHDVDMLLALGPSREEIEAVSLDVMGRGLAFVIVSSALKRKDASALLMEVAAEASSTGGASIHWFAERAGLATEAQWTHAIGGLVTSPKIIEAMVLHDGATIAQAAVREMHRRFPGMSFDEFAACDPRIKWLHADSSLLLADSPLVRDAMSRAWLATGR